MLPLAPHSRPRTPQLSSEGLEFECGIAREKLARLLLLTAAALEQDLAEQNAPPRIAAHAPPRPRAPQDIRADSTSASLQHLARPVNQAPRSRTRMQAPLCPRWEQPRTHGPFPLAAGEPHLSIPLPPRPRTSSLPTSTRLALATPLGPDPQGLPKRETMRRTVIAGIAHDSGPSTRACSSPRGNLMSCPLPRSPHPVPPDSL
jgi:hypothetical protein